MVRCARLFAICAACLISLVTGDVYEAASSTASAREASAQSPLDRSWKRAIDPLDSGKSQQEGQEKSDVGVPDRRASTGQESVFGQPKEVGIARQTGGPLSDEITKSRESLDAERAAGLPVTGTIHFHTEFEPVVKAGQDFGATMQVADRSDSISRSLNVILYFVLVRLDDVGEASPTHTSKDPVFSGSTSVQASNGWASVSNWRILKTGTYQIKAMCDGCAPALSPPMRVVSGEPFSLRLIQQPANSRSGESLSISPVVEATDAFGNLVSDLDGEVFVNMVPGTMGASRARVLDTHKMMMGTFTRSFKDGRAEFSGLAIGAAGIGHRLHFSLLSPVTARAVEVFSEPFNVEAGSPAELVFLQQPPDEITAGSPFTLEVRLIDWYGNAARGSHTIELSAWNNTSFFPLRGRTSAGTNVDSGLATFHEAACMTCETKVIGRSHSISVGTSSYILVTSCTLLREGNSDGGDQCVVTIALESLSHQWPKESVIVRVAEVEPVALHGESGELPLEIVPEILVFNPTEGLYSGEFIIKATDDTSLRYSTDSSDIQAGLFIQHYRVHLKVESPDMLWNDDAVEFVNDKYITIKVIDNDKKALAFSSLDEGPIVLRRGDSISYGLSLGFPPAGSVEVVLESPVGITTQPSTLQFDETNWAEVQSVTVHVTENFPAAPLVVWADSPRAVLAGESLELPFVLSAQPVQAVSVKLECSERLDPFTQMVTLTPQQWRRGATFRLRAIADDERECSLFRGEGCPAGRYSSLGTCVDCPEGFFCPVEGLKAPQACPPGTYSSQASVTCTECPSGSFCPTGSFADMQVRSPSNSCASRGPPIRLLITDFYNDQSA
ncbi:hypothetical protein Emed_002703 [Eimeria media]